MTRGRRRLWIFFQLRPFAKTFNFPEGLGNSLTVSDHSFRVSEQSRQEFSECQILTQNLQNTKWSCLTSPSACFWSSSSSGVSLERAFKKRSPTIGASLACCSRTWSWCQRTIWFRRRFMLTACGRFSTLLNRRLRSCCLPSESTFGWPSHNSSTRWRPSCCSSRSHHLQQFSFGWPSQAFICWELSLELEVSPEWSSSSSSGFVASERRPSPSPELLELACISGKKIGKKRWQIK